MATKICKTKFAKSEDMFHSRPRFSYITALYFSFVNEFEYTPLFCCSKFVKFVKLTKK